ncbi:hypothetical protein SAMN05216517_11074 [Janthinobacterium sp. OK676]|uniref:hypothetical protein n=1 Tax=unclassified Janthinobacterium TaxID=2610881 RepID=UPI00088B0595|nr:MULTISPECIES: hypothetical protein [unclassified Janthinobacterium]PJJ21468.1 hypothetical protein CLU90_4756 [Janthinobacterium sp. 67]SDN37953.1 hypothetical protein SAMN05216517_11074 [Janthinobacterium sp. OK676]
MSVRMAAAAPARKQAWQRRVLHLIAYAYGLSAVACLLFADDMAAGMGIFLNGVNGYSQFYATHVGVWGATALLALFAARQGEPPVLGDITAMLVLAQPAGRLFAAISFGLPQGFVLFLCAMELTAGLVLLLLRPAR